MPKTLLGQSALVAAAFLILESIYALTAGEVTYLAPVLTQAIPLKHLAIEQWHDGQLPLWSSMVGTGHPLIADATSLPFDWRYLLFLPVSTLDGYIAATVVTRVLGAVITFAYLRRRVGISGLPSFVGALVFLSSTSLVDEGTTLYTGVVAFPGLVWLSERVLESTTTERVLALGGAWGLFLFMNSLQYVPYLAVGAFAWCLIYARARDGSLDRGTVIRFLGGFAGAGAIGAGLAAVTLWPALELASHSNRGGEYPSDPFALDGLIGAVGIHNPSGAGYPLGTYYFYVGVISLAPIAVAIRHRSDPYVRAALWLGLGTAAVLLVGSVTKPALVDAFPALATIPFARPAFLIGFAAAILVAHGLEERDWRLGGSGRLGLAGLLSVQVGILLAAALLAGILLAERLESGIPSADLEDLLDPLYVGVLALILTVVRASGLGASLVSGPSAPRIGRFTSSRRLVVGVLLVIELALAWGLARPMTVQGGYATTPEERFLQAATDANQRAMEIMPRPNWKPVLPGPQDLSLHQNAPAYSGIPTTNVYSSLISSDYSETFDAFGDAAYRRSIIERAPNSSMQTTRYDSPLIRALGVGYLYSSSQLPQPRQSALAFAGDGYYVYAVNDPLPRAFFAGRARWRPQDELHQQLRALAADRPGSIDLGPEILLEGTEREEGRPAYAPARVTSDRGSHVEASVSAPGPGFLVLSDVHLPGWSAEVDGQPARIYKANGFARAVRVPPGEHTVEFRYGPSSVNRGALLSGATAILCLALLAVTAFRRRSPRPPRSS